MLFNGFTVGRAFPAASGRSDRLRTGVARPTRCGDTVFKYVILNNEEAASNSTPKGRTQEPAAKVKVWQRKIKSNFHSDSNLVCTPDFRSSAIHYGMYNDIQLTFRMFLLPTAL